MRARVAIVVTTALALAGCSFLLSEDFAADDSLPPAEAGPDTAVAPDTGPGVVPDAASASDAGADADADAALDPSLVAFWTFDHGAGTTQRDETNRYDLSVAGATIDPTGGFRGGAVVFAGSTSAQVDQLSGLSFPKQGTLSIWFKHNFPDSDTTTQGLFDDWDDQRSHLFFRRIGSDAPGRIQVALQPKVTSSSYAWAFGFDTVKGTWTHAVLTWDSAGKTASFYVDGVIRKQGGFGSGETFDPTEQQFRLSSGFVGAVDEVRLYDRVLPEAEALMLP